MILEVEKIICTFSNTILSYWKKYFGKNYETFVHYIYFTLKLVGFLLLGNKSKVGELS